MKKIYEAPELELLKYKFADVMNESNFENETDQDPIA